MRLSDEILAALERGESRLRLIRGEDSTEEIRGLWILCPHCGAWGGLPGRALEREDVCTGCRRRYFWERLGPAEFRSRKEVRRRA